MPKQHDTVKVKEYTM